MVNIWLLSTLILVALACDGHNDKCQGVVLLLVDVQPAFFEGFNISGIYPTFEGNVTALLHAVRHSAGQVAFVHANYYLDQTPWLPAVIARYGLPANWSVDGNTYCSFAQPYTDEIVIKKSTFDPWTSSNLPAYMNTQKPTTVIVAGLTTTICILHTATGAVNNGYNTYIAYDAVAETSVLWSQVTLDANAFRFAGYPTTADIAAWICSGCEGDLA